MSLATQINDEIKKAMLARDKDRLAALRDVKSKILLESTSGGSAEISDELVIKICLKLFKQRMETYELYIAQNREDLAHDELVQAKIIEEYLPKMLSDDDVKKEVAMAIESSGAKGIQDIGKVMGILSSKLAGKADGKVIAAFTKEALANL
jgi:uncharacterized protein YqeY